MLPVSHITAFLSTLGKQAVNQHIQLFEIHVERLKNTSILPCESISALHCMQLYVHFQNLRGENS